MKAYLTKTVVVKHSIDKNKKESTLSLRSSAMMGLVFSSKKEKLAKNWKFKYRQSR